MESVANGYRICCTVESSTGVVPGFDMVQKLSPDGISGGDGVGVRKGSEGNPALQKLTEGLPVEVLREVHHQQSLSLFSEIVDQLLDVLVVCLQIVFHVGD